MNNDELKKAIAAADRVLRRDKHITHTPDESMCALCYGLASDAPTLARAVKALVGERGPRIWDHVCPYCLTQAMHCKMKHPERYEEGFIKVREVIGDWGWMT